MEYIPVKVKKFEERLRNNTMCNRILRLFKDPANKYTIYYPSMDGVKNHLHENSFLYGEWIYIWKVWEWTFYNLWPKAKFTTNDRVDQVFDLLVKDYNISHNVQ